MAILNKVKLARLTQVDLAWLHFKAALGFMLWIPMWTNPTLQQQLTGQFFIVWMIITSIGFIFSVVGLIMGVQSDEGKLKGFKIEMVGLWLLMSGPLVFMGVMGGVWIVTGQQRALAVMFAYVVGAAVYARMVMVRAAIKSLTYRFPGEVEAVLEEAVIRAEARASAKAEARAETRADADDVETEEKEADKNA